MLRPTRASMIIFMRSHTMRMAAIISSSWPARCLDIVAQMGTFARSEARKPSAMCHWTLVIAAGAGKRSEGVIGAPRFAPKTCMPEQTLAPKTRAAK